jgi:hypothetical protein
VRGNVGFVFTRGDLVEVRDKLLENKVRAPARNGAIAPCPVIIPAQNTGLGPEKTSFFQALSIPTKISKGTIEIIVSKVSTGDSRLSRVMVGEGLDNPKPWLKQKQLKHDTKLFYVNLFGKTDVQYSGTHF